MTSPRVSVIVPCFNHAAFLRQRIESILEQTYDDFEVILLDDASTDGSRDILEGYVDGERIHGIFNDRNSGFPSKQWNRGVAAARGEFVWIAESDDVAEPEFLEVLVDRLDAHPSAGIAYCQSWLMDADARILGSFRCWTEDLHPTRWGRDFFNYGPDECRFLARRNTIPNASAVVFRKSLYETVGGASEMIRHNSDWLLWTLMLHHADIVFVARHLSGFRQHPESFTLCDDMSPEVGPLWPGEPDGDSSEWLSKPLRNVCARIAFDLARRAFRAGRPQVGRARLRQSFRSEPSLAAALLYGFSFLGGPLVGRVDDAVRRRPSLQQRLGQLLFPESVGALPSRDVESRRNASGP